MWLQFVSQNIYNLPHISANNHVQWQWKLPIPDHYQRYKNLSRVSLGQVPSTPSVSINTAMTLATYIGLIEINGNQYSHPRMGLQPILTWLLWFLRELYYSSLNSLDSAWTLTFGVYEPLLRRANQNHFPGASLLTLYKVVGYCA